MAKKVEGFVFQRGGVSYPDEWFDGDPWELLVGEGKNADVKNAKTAEQAFRKKAKEMGLGARVSIDVDEDGKGTMKVQAYEKDGEAAPKPKRMKAKK